LESQVELRGQVQNLHEQLTREQQLFDRLASAYDELRGQSHRSADSKPAVSATPVGKAAAE
jgi:hypothetical protein